MNHVRDRSFWVTVVLVALGFMALVLSFAALATVRAGSSGEVADARTFDFTRETEDVVAADVPMVGEVPEEVSGEATSGAGDDELLTVIVGDSNSLGEAETWIGATAEGLEWGSVVNLSAPGRGYTATPRVCDESPCAPFPGTVDAVAELEPDVVVTFGGAADGDVPITTVAAQYFSELRAALPDAQIVAISPVYSGETVPDWAPLHRASIHAGVEVAGGTFVDVGQPSLGDGDGMSPEAHAQIAQTVIENLQG